MSEHGGRTSTDVVCYYHEPLKAPLLREAVLPAMLTASGAGVGAHVERHWLHGPHVRIHVAGSPDMVEAVSEAVSDELAAYVRRRPSRASLSRVALLARAEATGRAELVPPPYEPIWPDNTVRIEDSDRSPLGDVLGPDTIAVRAEVLRAGVPAISDTLADLERRGDTPSSRVHAAVTALAMHAACSPSGLHGGYLSFRSHLEDHLHRNDPDGVARARHATIWNRHAEGVLGVVGACRPADDHGAPAPADAWRRWTIAAWRIVEAAYDRGDLAFPSTLEYERRARVLGDPALADRSAPAGQGRGISEFHRMYRATRRSESEHLDRQFVIYRFCTNMLYLLLAVCDLAAAERYLAASLVCEAVERLSGQTWRERLASSRHASAPEAFRR